MRRIMLMLFATLLLAMVPAVASAQLSEEAAAAKDSLEAAVGDLGGETAEEWAESAATVEAARAELEAAAAELDYAEFNAALADLDAAIESGDLEAIAAAAAAVAPAYDVLAAQAEAGDTAEPTQVATGDEVNPGPNVALLAVAAILAALAIGAFWIRSAVDRR